MGNTIYLSICIPTYNRAEYLDRTLNSIVIQSIFFLTNEVEIVVCDNCSIDNTALVVRKYIVEHGEKIKYYRNESNITEANVESVLKLGNGLFLKLNNDTLNHTYNSLDVMLDLVKSNLFEKPMLFFINGLVKKKKILEHKEIESFLKVVSFYSTWIACFGIWKKNINQINNFHTIKQDKLIVRVLFELIKDRKIIIIENSKIFYSDTPKSKGGYNFYEVFAGNYLNILKTYNNEKHISNFTLYVEKAKLMIKFLIPWTLILQNKDAGVFFNTNNWLKILWNQYKYHPILYVGIFYFFVKKIHKKIS